MTSYKLSVASIIDVQKGLAGLIADNPSGIFDVRVKKWSAGRSLSANAQQHVWYPQIAKQRGDITWRTVKLICKAMFGIPIMLESDKHREKTEYLINKLEYYNSTYEFQLELADIICPTSNFSTAESSTYMDLMIEYWNTNGCQINYQTN